MIHSVEIALILIFTVIAFEAISGRVSLPSPFLLLPAGILLGYVPGFPHLSLDPDLVLYVFLPLLVYPGAALGSWMEFRKNIRPIALLSVGCVLFTTAAVAVSAHWLIPSLGWGAAFVLGAVVSPPDDVAAIAITRKLAIPKGISAVLEGEGLVNDAAALTIYRLAAAAVVTHSFSFVKGAGSFAAVVVGETAWGIFVGWGMLQARRWLHHTTQEISLSLLTPFVAYLPAELAGGTGVLATVAAAFYISYRSSHMVRATTRLQIVPLWQIIEFVLDGVLFLVAGMQLHRILEPLSHTAHRLLLEYGIGVSAVVILARIVWVFASSESLKRLGVAVRPREPHPRWQRFFVVSWSGMRGAISLAAALSIPLVTTAGAPFPGRDLIIYLTFAVIVATLLLQGLTLPWFIRYFKIDREGRRERAESEHREIDARRRTTEKALALLAARRKEEAYPATLLDRLEDQYRNRHKQFNAHLAGDHEGAMKRAVNRFNVQSELIDTERAEILRLREEGVIDDEILRRIERDLDLQEMRLRQGVAEYELNSETK